MPDLFDPVEEEVSVAQRMYNYRRFTLDEYQLDRFPGPEAGERAIDFTARALDGGTLRLADLRGRTVVLEAGSITCAQYVSRIGRMNQLAGEFPDVVFAVLYAREAHPGIKIGEHRTTEDKLSRARLVGMLESDRCLVLVDDLGGTVHRAYGALPNFVYVIDPQGTVLFRSDWNKPKAVRAVLHGPRSPRELRGQVRPVAPRILIRVLLRAGRDALFDFTAAIPKLVLTHVRNAVNRNVASHANSERSS